MRFNTRVLVVGPVRDNGPYYPLSWGHLTLASHETLKQGLSHSSVLVRQGLYSHTRKGYYLGGVFYGYRK